MRVEENGVDHLPECYLSGPPSLCPMCEALRACEERVRDEELVWHWRQGVQAARDAVAALFPQERYPDEHAAILDALAAIDALRGES